MVIKTEVLHYLLEHPGEYVSGVMLSGMLDCSRMAICKAIVSLQKEGYSIESSKRLGYKLTSSSDVLSKVSLQMDLNSPDIGIYFYKEIDSTNKKAKELILQGAKPPFVVVADRQTAGRGRLGRSFSSPEGGMYFSIALSGSEISSPDLITTSASLAVSRTMERLTGIKSEIKWVNDLYIGKKKCTGILTEGILNMEEGGLSQVVIGIGVNLCSNPSLFPKEVQAIATFFYPDEECPITRSQAISECVKDVIKIQKEDFLPEYRRRCFVLGRTINVRRGDRLMEGKALAVDDSGHLVVQFTDDSVESLSSGEISIKL